MRTTLILLLIIVCGTALYGQKQTTQYFEFTYSCDLWDSSYNSDKKSWSYIYGDEVNELVITVDVTLSSSVDAYSKDLIDGIVSTTSTMSNSPIRVVVGSYNGNYAAIATGYEHGNFVKMATFISENKMFIISFTGDNKELLLKQYSKLEKTFITK